VASHRDEKQGVTFYKQAPAQTKPKQTPLLATAQTKPNKTPPAAFGAASPKPPKSPKTPPGAGLGGAPVQAGGVTPAWYPYAPIPKPHTLTPTPNHSNPKP